MSKPAKKLRQPIVVVLGHIDHGKCIHPDDKVLMPSGEYVEIKKLYPEKPSIVYYAEGGYEFTDFRNHIVTCGYKNGVLKAYSTEASHVWRVWYSGYLINVETEDGRRVRVTPEHPFLTSNGWKPAYIVNEDDYIATIDDEVNSKIKFSRISRISLTTYKGYLYDLSIPCTNTFLANGIVVHNTTLLDRIRGTSVAKREPGEITQHVGASIVPARVIEEIAAPLKKMIPIKLIIPGLLFIDTPGHELFVNMRRRGGSVADFAILVIDVMEGVKEQTVECIELLRSRKVPFLVAANKIDRIPGWKSHPGEPFIFTYRKQAPETRRLLDEKIYRLIGELGSFGFNSDRFDRIRDFTRTVAIVPISAKTGEGIPELLAVLAGLTQQYLRKRLLYAEGPGKGVVLEVKETPGLGYTIDVILYDGVLKKGDTIVVGSLEGPIVTKVRALLMPKPLQEMRAPEDKFMQVEEVYAASGVKVAAPGLEKAVAGTPLFVVTNNEELEEAKRKVVEEIERARIKTDKTGVIAKADTLGTLEALVEALKRNNIPVREADVGPISKRDVLEANVSREKDKTLGVVLGFNVKVLPEAREEAKKNGVKIMINNVIYRLIEDYLKWREKVKKEEKLRELESLVRPAKLRIIPGCVFRRSEPAIVGVEILGGVLKPGAPLMREDCRKLGHVMQIQERGQPLKEARVGMQVAISIRGNVMIGRHVDEGDIIYTDIPESHARLLLTKFKSELSDDEIMVLNEIIKLKRKTNPFFALV